MYTLHVDGVSKRFGFRKVLSGINFELHTGESMAIVGPNGSGKTTLLMMLLGCLRQTSGNISFLQEGDPLNREQIRRRSSLVSPYLNLYDNLTAEENLKFFATVSGGSITGKEVDSSLARLGLEGRGMDPVSQYSSGMKQRLKYAVALSGDPDFLFLDEPTSNLDDDGKQIVADIVESCRSDRIIVIATNEQEDCRLVGRQCRLDQ
ncbi:MAG: ABC transporter ATP-binding protein [Candidatus Zixiibacteriota bacterium]|nr:MAG: ABC transporter ATP-binding protein [candidate division Zixibacteria bacterium]